MNSNDKNKTRYQGEWVDEISCKDFVECLHYCHDAAFGVGGSVDVIAECGAGFGDVGGVFMLVSACVSGASCSSRL